MNYFNTYILKVISKAAFIRYVVIILALLFCRINYVSAQVKVQVVTTTVEKSFDYNRGDKVIIKGEKASISVRDWDRSEVKIVLKLISKHADKAIAEKELGYSRYILERNKNGINIKNYFAIDKGVTKVNAILKVEYEIYAPKDALLDIESDHGNITIKNISSKITIDAKYGAINLQNITGEVKLTSYFADITGDKLEGSYTIKTNHSNVALNGMKGKYRINTVYGDVSLTPVNTLSGLDIKTQNGDVTLETGNYKQYNYNLYASYGDIKLPNGSNYPFSKFTEEKKELVNITNSTNATIKIEASFGLIVMK